MGARARGRYDWGMHSFFVSVSWWLLSQVDSPVPLTLTLRVEADGFASNAGHAIARLYTPGMQVTGEPVRSVKAEIINGSAHFDFTELLAGEWAVVVVHDRNDNGRIDHTLGLPSEPLGFSNGFRLSLFSGMPTFEKLRFVLSSATASQRVTVR